MDYRFYVTAGFLTVRKFSWKQFHWFLLSQIIKFVQGKYVHTFIKYHHNGCDYIREMSGKGVKQTPWQEYLNKNRDRIECIVIETVSSYDYYRFVEWCRTNDAKYEYKNLLVFQVFKKIFGYFPFKATSYRRICSEDTARGLNILMPHFVNNPDQVSPTELYNTITKKIKEQFSTKWQ